MEPNTDHIWQNKIKKQIHVGNHASNNNLAPNHFNFRLKLILNFRQNGFRFKTETQRLKSIANMLVIQINTRLFINRVRKSVLGKEMDQN
jgi:hypothetical protein